MQPSAGGSSKHELNDAEDNQLSSSADEVVSNDDLLTEILLRLPVLSLVLFKSVSKHWLSLITDPNFTLLRSQNPKVDPPSGLFLKLQTLSSEFTFLSLDSRLPVKKITSSFSFDVNSGSIEVLQSCNGLLLCCIRPDKFYVFNPSLNLYKLLPLPNVWDPNRLITDMAIAFDPVVSPHYKVLYPLGDFTTPGISIHIEIYSSQTRKWSVCAHKYSFESFQGFHDVIYWRDAIHWMGYLDETFHFKLDLEKPHFIEVETPDTVIGKSSEDKLLESCNCLLLVRMVHARSLHMNVYEMKNDYSQWSIKYFVNLDHVSTECNRNYLCLNQRFIVRSFVLGEREEDSFFMVEVPGKLIRYNIFSNTFSELCESVPICPRVTQFCSFLFIPSLVGV